MAVADDQREFVAHSVPPETDCGIQTDGRQAL
jgi:hypothetical protein